ncbi:ribosome maturation factor RimM [Mesoplasma lactucae]|uniref:Ribosome maturation factor RimM n=1 Tax=Mesoplasma lactucae ATCC 49193 TaxID=81460 RepID=A0A291IRF2_9MOLU|nr:hypothetical protein [Mesoplasma lactucae]ATG97314.1 hypothetical protein CP520_00890 [Mesoplasma lactucae ATCC 49193]ATZ20235.1 16S rRNA processing protein RimM [Mesoplasma lactucae ATCC 49193]MCL8216984.1 Ribosome maturation factor RimM [Mesoplasma lactucae ATCC 49193]
MNNLESQLILIGKIVNTFGKNGQVKLLLDDNLELVSDDLVNKIFFYEDANKILQPLKIVQSTQTQQNLLQIKFEGIDNISQAEALKNRKVYSLRKDNLFDEVPDFTTYNLIFTLNDKERKTPIISVMENGQYNLFKIKWNGKEIWVPGVEEYIENIDTIQKNIFAKNIERLI